MREGPTEFGRVATRQTKWLFGLGSVAFGVKEAAFAYFLLIYYNQVLGLDPVLAGTALAIAMAVDAFSDLGIGYWSDQLRSALGRRHPFMYSALIPVALSFYFLWNPPALALTNDLNLFAYLTVMAILVRLAVTLFEVPNAAQGPELSSDYDDRTRVQAFRYAFGWFGGLLIGALSLLVLFNLDAEKQLGPTGYQWLGIVGAATMVGAAFASALGTHKHIGSFHQPPEVPSRGPAQAVRYTLSLFASPSFRAMFVAALFLGAAQGLNQALLVYVNTFFWGLSSTQIGYLPLLGLISVPLSFFIAPRLAERLGKKRAAIGLYLFAIAFLPVPYVLALVGLFPEPSSQLYVPLIMLSYLIETGALISMQIVYGSMNADLVEDRSVAQEGSRDEGLIFAARNFCKKVVSGSGILLAGIVLWLADFPEHAVLGEVDRQSVNRLLYWFIPMAAGLYLLSCWCLSFYRIDRAQHHANLKSLATS